jgi:transposase
LRRWLDAALAGPVALQSQVFSAGGSTTVMGIKEREFRPLSDNLSLEELVSKANFYRRQEGWIDLSFVRKLVLDRYASVGRTSIDPVVFFRLQLVMFFEGIRSERQLMEIASDHLSVRWYIGYDLHEPLSNHSSLTRIRERYGLEILKGFVEKIVEMCVEVGLVGREEVFLFDQGQSQRGDRQPRFQILSGNTPERAVRKVFDLRRRKRGRTAKH